MANFKEFDDLNEIHENLWEDDWNKNNQYVFKFLKSKAGTSHHWDFATKLGVGFGQEKRNCELEQTVEYEGEEFMGWNSSFAGKQNGKIEFNNSFKGFFNTLGCDEKKEATLTLSGEVSSADGLDMDVGVKHSGADHHLWFRSQLNNNPLMQVQGVWRPVDWLVWGEQFKFSKDIKKTDFESRFTFSFPGSKGHQAASYINGTYEDGLKNVTMGGNVVHESGNSTAGSHVNFDFETRKLNTSILFQNKQEDHSWRFLAHSSGMVQAMLQWQLHKCCKASVNTSLDCGEVPSGQISALPWAASFEIKY